MPDLFLSPHNDDAPLFGSFIIRATNPLVVVVYDSYVQTVKGYPGCSTPERRLEDINAMRILNPGSPVQFLGLDDRRPDTRQLESAFRGLRNQIEEGPVEKITIWIPQPERRGNRHHNAVAWCAEEVFGGHECVELRRYMTYTEAGRSTSSKPVPFERDWVRLKLLALACYRSQINLEDNCEHFMRPLLEYFGDVGPSSSVEKAEV